MGACKSSCRLSDRGRRARRHRWHRGLASSEKFRGEEKIKMKQLFHNAVFRLAIALLLLSITPACSKRDSAGGRDSSVDYWTCTMHPSVHAKDPGKCPICSMDLVPVTKDSATPVRSTKKHPQHDHAAMLA